MHQSVPSVADSIVTLKQSTERSIDWRCHWEIEQRSAVSVSLVSKPLAETLLAISAFQ